ncbi:MAG: hypothetical protein JWP63_4914, partial [Candidatus Solibacter sp.]|nr:hypothetical protein [Candidatus Solibacter sp.]
FTAALPPMQTVCPLLTTAPDRLSAASGHRAAARRAPTRASPTLRAIRRSAVGCASAGQHQIAFPANGPLCCLRQTRARHLIVRQRQRDLGVFVLNIHAPRRLNYLVMDFVTLSRSHSDAAPIEARSAPSGYPHAAAFVRFGFTAPYLSTTGTTLRLYVTSSLNVVSVAAACMWSV